MKFQLYPYSCLSKSGAQGEDGNLPDDKQRGVTADLYHAGLLLGKADASSKIVMFSMKKVIPEQLASCRASNSKRKR